MLELGGAQQNTLYTVEHLDRGRFETILIAGPGGLLDDDAARIPGLVFETCPWLRREVSPFADLRAVVDLVRRLRRLRPDLVHTHSSKAGLLGRLAAAIVGVPVIVHTVHGWSFHSLLAPRRHACYVALESFGATLGSALVSVSHADAAEGHRYGIAPLGAFEIIRSGVRLAEFGRPEDRGYLRRELGLAEGVPLVGMIACLKPQKAPLDFVALAERVGRERKDVHFVLAGDGELRGSVERALGSTALGERFHLLGWRRDPQRILADLDLFVLTSRHEGLPRVIPEARACGKAIVATAVNGSPEALVNGRHGYLCEPGDVEALARRTQELLAAPALRCQMGQWAREGLLEWDIDEMVRRQELLYDRLCAQAGLPSAGGSTRESR